MRVGVDVGGTFTDVAVVDDQAGSLTMVKVLTESDSPSKGVIAALHASGLNMGAISTLVHGTTLAINTVIEQRGAVTGLVATQGFRDIIELRRGARTHLADPLMTKPMPYVPGRRRLEVNERVGPDGDMLAQLPHRDFVRKVRTLVDAGTQSLAICFIHSYANPANELEAARLLDEHFPGLHYTLSSQIVPEIREFERTSTAVLNAYLQPRFSDYVRDLDEQTGTAGLHSGLLIMQSNGGLTSATDAAEAPIKVLESGPAAGAIGAAYIGSLVGLSDLITFDMGGTTAKASVVEAGRPLISVEYELFEESNRPGSGWPIRVPMVDIVEVGAGGGSIAWLDDAGHLRVGPHSAGADPGPVCYGRGGTEPTITDANAALGRLHSLLGGELALDISGAMRAIQERIARPLGLQVEEAAAGILEVASARAADSLRLVTLARGRDPRDFTVMAFGGAGPLEVGYIVSELDVARALIPVEPGNFSAVGLLCADALHDTARTRIQPFRAPNAAADIKLLFSEMEEELGDRLSRHGFDASATRFENTVDLRYIGQYHVLSIPVARSVTDTTIGELQEAFHREHERLFTFRSASEVELVAARCRAVTSVPRPSLPSVSGRDPRDAVIARRRVYYRETKSRLESMVYDRTGLAPGVSADGPAIIEEKTSTTLVPPGLVARVDAWGNLLLERA